MHRSRRLQVRRLVSAVVLSGLFALASAAAALASAGVPMGGGGGPWPS